MLSEALLSIDLGALRTLRLVHRLNSFSAAARELDVKQSSVSYTIDRLRRVLGDPLFVRQGAKIVATARCLEVVDAAERLMIEAERLAISDDFDPSGATGEITLCCNYYARLTFLGDVVRRLRAEAPNVSLVMTSGFDAATVLESGAADLALSPLPQEHSGIHRDKITTDTTVCLMDRDNDLAHGEMTLDRYLAASHATLAFGGGYKNVMQRDLESQGMRTRDAVLLPDPGAMPNIISGTDLVATIPSRFARIFADQLVVRAAPRVWTTQIFLYWPASLHRSPLNGWVRGLIRKAAADLPPPMTF